MPYQDSPRPSGTSHTPHSLETILDLLGHVCVVIDWLPAMLDAPAPGKAEISAAEYYRPDDRFSPQANGTRIALAQDRAARSADGAAFAEDFAATWRRVERLCRIQPVSRTVRMRHGDADLLAVGLSPHPSRGSRRPRP